MHRRYFLLPLLLSALLLMGFLLLDNHVPARATPPASPKENNTCAKKTGDCSPATPVPAPSTGLEKLSHRFISVYGLY